jgi:hypothetical protein
MEVDRMFVENVKERQVVKACILFDGEYAVAGTGENEEVQGAATRLDS